LIICNHTRRSQEKQGDSFTFIPPSKRSRKRLSVNFATAPNVFKFEWISEWDLDGKLNRSEVEIGDGATSRVYFGDMDSKQVAVKQLKCYSLRLAPVLVKIYEPLFNLWHENVVKVFRICPQAGQIVLECCEKSLVN